MKIILILKLMVYLFATFDKFFFRKDQKRQQIISNKYNKITFLLFD